MRMLYELKERNMCFIYLLWLCFFATQVKWVKYNGLSLGCNYLLITLDVTNCCVKLKKKTIKPMYSFYNVIDIILFKLIAFDFWMALFNYLFIFSKCTFNYNQTLLASLSIKSINVLCTTYILTL